MWLCVWFFVVVLHCSSALWFCIVDTQTETRTHTRRHAHTHTHIVVHFWAPRFGYLNPVLIISRRTSASFRLGNGIRYSDVLSDAHLAPRTVDIVSYLVVFSNLDCPAGDVAVSQRARKQIVVVCLWFCGWLRQISVEYLQPFRGEALPRFRRRVSWFRGEALPVFGWESTTVFRLGISNRFSAVSRDSFFIPEKRL